MVCHKPREVDSGANQDTDRLPRLYCRLNKHDLSAAPQQGQESAVSLPEPASPRPSDSKRSGKIAGSVSSDIKGSVSSSTALPELADNANSVTPENSEKVQGTDDLDLRMQIRAQMVDRELKRLEW